ncbi:MAG: DNA polymerase III subunit delta' [Shewanella sp.]|uniref:DNA polymerase III subunit delta' n=1 Tax=Shewanella sp. TaxID=50422 RepID=UPI003F3252E3
MVSYRADVMTLPWLDAPRQAFLAQLQAGQLPHALLVGIDSAYGGQLLSEFMARSAMCQQPTLKGGCGKCKACLLFDAGNHPDCYQIHADGHQIKVDQIRELCTRLTATAQQSGQRVAIIYHSERLNTAAANALLKTLEEPGRDTLLILQSDTPARLMATITSRCQRLPFVAPPQRLISTWLSQHYHVQEDVTWCLSVVGGPLMLAESLHSDGTQPSRYQSLLQLRKDWAQSLSTGHLSGSLLTVGEQQIIDVLKVLFLMFRQVLLKNTQLDAYMRAQIGELAANVMGMCHSLSTMPTVNYLGLCQSYVLKYRLITKK